MNELSEEFVRSWGTRDVALWLQEIGFGYCAQDFRSNRIDGPALLSLTTSGLRSYRCLSDGTKRENLKAQIAKLPGSALVKGGGLTRKASRGDKKRRAAQLQDDSVSPPPLPERPQPQVNVDHQQYGEDEDEYSFDDDDSFDSDSDFYDEEDAGNNNNNNKASLAPPEPPAAQSQDSIRKLQAKFMAFGLRGMDNQQLTPAEEQYLEEDEDDQDVYDVPPEFQHQYYMPPEEEEDEGDIYDVPPEEAQGHYPPPTTQEPHHMPPKNFTSSPQPVTKFPQLRAPIKQTDKVPHAGGVAANTHHDPPKTSSGISDRMKAFQNSANETGKNAPGKPSNSPKLPAKFPKSPQLPPKNQHVVPNSQDDHHDGDDSALSNMPEHLRDRFKRSKQQSRIRKQSKGQEDSPPEPTTELPSQQKSAIANNPFLQKQAPKQTQDKLDTSDNAGKSIKDRMKMFSSSNPDEPVTPKSPTPQKWPPNDSKQPPVSSMGRPPMDAKQKPPPKLPAENRRPVIPNGRDAPSAPPLPDRNTKPPKFGGSGKRPPMPLPATSYDDEENYDPPTVHVPQPVNDENYDPPQFHREEQITMDENYDPPQLHQEIQEDTYDPPPLPNRIPGSPGFAASKQPRFPPKEDRRTTEPVLPPRPPKSNAFIKGPAVDPAAAGRRNTFATPNVKPPMEKPAAKPPRSASPNPLESYPWYHGDIDRKTIESALDKDSIDGCFIVRNPSKPEEKKLGFYSLSIWHCGKTRHLRIRCRSDKKYVVGESKDDERSFDSVAELIRFHKKTPLLLKSGGSTVLTCLPTSLS